MFPRNLFLASATAAFLLVDSTEGFAAKPYYLTASMPQELVEWSDCDETLWNEFPPGAKKDLLRFVASDLQDLATARVESMRSYLEFVHEKGDGAPGDPFVYENWAKGVLAWEENNIKLMLEAKQRAKEEKKEKRKLEALKKAAELEAANEAAEEAAAAAEEVAKEGEANNENFQ